MNLISHNSRCNLICWVDLHARSIVKIKLTRYIRSWNFSFTILLSCVLKFELSTFWSCLVSKLDKHSPDLHKLLTGTLLLWDLAVKKWHLFHNNEGRIIMKICTLQFPLFFILYFFFLLWLFGREIALLWKKYKKHLNVNNIVISWKHCKRYGGKYHCINVESNPFFKHLHFWLVSFCCLLLHFNLDHRFFWVIHSNLTSDDQPKIPNHFNYLVPDWLSASIIL